MKHWDYQTDIAWDKLDRSKIDPALVPLVKAAALVEYNGAVYAEYLCKIFKDDPEFCQAARDWGVEEIQHGQSLGKWANLVDPSFDLEDSFKRFTSGYQQVPPDASASVRGSRAGEMIARCIVETGTSSYYTALMEATDEPVLKDICRHIAADEFRHYKLFYQTFKKYVEIDRLGAFTRLKIALGRVAESEDDELAYAYFAANENKSKDSYRRDVYSQLYVGGASKYYQRHHIDRAVGMVLKAAGLSAKGILAKGASSLAWRMTRKKANKAA
ncbi:MAG: ferritin-like domain-containing protein [Dongiaceae bacterium]